MAQALSAALQEALTILEPSEQFVTLAPCLLGLARARAHWGVTPRRRAFSPAARPVALHTGPRHRRASVAGRLPFPRAAMPNAARTQDWAADLAGVAGEMPMPVAAAATAQRAARP